MPPTARILGLAGLLPSIACLVAMLAGGEAVWFLALAIAYAYAALILSFLGGLWWGLAAARPDAPHWIYGIAVAPSLVALASAIPWAFGDEWPGPSLLLLGVMLLLSLIVDFRLAALGIAPGWWIGLRLPLSLGLGTLTLACGLLAIL